MGYYYDKSKLEEAAINNPDKLFKIHFERFGKGWRSSECLPGYASTGTRSDRTTFLPYTDKNGVIQGWRIAHNGEGFAAWTMWNYLQKRENVTKEEIFEYVAGIYGIEPEYPGATEEEREEARRQHDKAKKEKAALNLIAKILTSTLYTETEDAQLTRQYIAGRGLQPSERLGVCSTEVKKQCVAAVCHDLQLTEKEAREIVNRQLYTGRADYTDNKAGKWIDFANFYRLAIPYYNGAGTIRGFSLRFTAPGEPPKYTDKDGNEKRLQKYCNSLGMSLGGYCEQLDGTKPCYIVEGQMDAEAMKQAGFANVFAIAGQGLTENKEKEDSSKIDTLKRYRVKNLVYIPDLEYNEDGTPKTTATENAIKNLLPHLSNNLAADGFHTLKIAPLPNPRGEEKQDAASVLQYQGAAAMRAALDSAANWYEWKILKAVEEHRGNPEDLAQAAIQIYNSIPSYTARELLRQQFATHGENNKTAAAVLKPEAFADLQAAGVTAYVLKQIERAGSATTYRDAIAPAVEEVKRAIDNHATAEKIGTALDNAQRVQHRTDNTSFAAQVNYTEEDFDALVRNRPAPIRTSWQLFKEKDTRHPEAREYRESRFISFAPANVSIIAAPTTHGKTLFMMQAAINYIREYGKHFIYVSLENDAEALYIRALSAYIGNKLDKVMPGNDMKTESAWEVYFPCSNTRYPVTNKRQALRDFIDGTGSPRLYSADGEALNLKKLKEEYWKEIGGKLHFVRPVSDCERLCDNIATTVEEFGSAGLEVGGVVVDYIQLLHYAGKTYSRTDELKSICDRLNDLAKETRLPIICGAQMNRSATQNNASTLPPFDSVALANIGESSGIENIAEDCFFIYRTDYIGAPKDANTNAGRLARVFDAMGERQNGCLYVECLKGRENETGGFCLLPAAFTSGSIPTERNYNETDGTVTTTPVARHL